MSRSAEGQGLAALLPPEASYKAHIGLLRV